MQVDDHFDAVLMLTWSDWKTEPRSNRYHYATRFARTLPVLFLQHGYVQRERLVVEPSGVDNIDLIHVSCGITPAEVKDLRELLHARGIRRPLLWIYDSMNYWTLLDAMPRAFRVFHATEDYLTETKGQSQDMKVLATSLKALFKETDFMVACAEGVARSYRHAGGYTGPCVVAENGCDAEFFLHRLVAHEHIDLTSRKPIAIFQGGINRRIDFGLLAQVVQRMPDWEFRFCGTVLPDENWDQICSFPNVTYLGKLEPEQVAEQMIAADCGLIPYIQDEWIGNSYPLKAYEYVASGLPVVSVPITCLARAPELFDIARDAPSFELAIRSALPKRTNPVLLEQRAAAARANSYDSRFAVMENALLQAVIASRQTRKKLKALMLYDSMSSMHVSTIAEHLEAFKKYSRHAFTYLSATPSFWGPYAGKVDEITDLSVFDVVIVHYSTRLSVADHLDHGLARELSDFPGLKMLFIQDEYEGVEIARRWMDQIRFDVVYTCVPKESVETIYPSYRFPVTEFLPTLTGYVPEDPKLEQFAKPLAERHIAIAYRGRALHPVYGNLGQEKFGIGVALKSIAEKRGIPVDIEVDDSKRIYGPAWYEFLGSARATLGTESGANVFDFDGTLRRDIDRLRKIKPDISYQEIAERILAPHEGLVCMNQISPKIFEAIRLRTALILFEGSYSGVIDAHTHYIPLKKDFSNIDEVLNTLGNDTALTAMTERAYADVVSSGKFSYRRFVEQIDADIDERFSRNTLRENEVSAVFVMKRDGSLRLAMPLLPDGLWVGAAPTGYPFPVLPLANGRTPGVQLLAELTNPRFERYPVLRKVVRLAVPASVRRRVVPSVKTCLSRAEGAVLPLVRWGWRRLPLSFRQRAIRLLGHS